MSRGGAALLLAGLALPLVPDGAVAQALAPLPLRSGEVVIDVRATTVNDFDARVPVARAEFTGGDLASVTAYFEVRVAEMRTGIGLRDRHLRGALDADSFPVVRFDVTRIAVPGAATDSMSVVFEGRLTLHGVTRPLRVPGTLVRRPTTIEVRVARFPLDMREYGITPPSRFLGAVKVRPDVHVNATLVFGP